MKLTKGKQQQLALVALVTLIIILGLYFGLISNQLDKISALDKQIAEAGANVEKATRAINKSTAIQEELTSLKNRISEIETNNMPPPTDMYSWFVDTLRKFLVPYQNQINLPFRSREVVGDVGMFATFPYKSATFSVRGDGTFHQLGRFIADLENRFQYFRLQRVVMAATGEFPEAPNRLSVELDIVTLVKPINQ